jgi:hypothetical protein
MPPPWISTERVGAQWGLEKNLDENRYDTKTQNQSNETGPIAVPLGDFRFNEKARARQLDVLMGVVPKAERNEIIVNEQRFSDRPKTRSEEWEANRVRALNVSKEHSEVALKRDGSSWSDEDGYSKVLEPPAFRDGFNNTLRVKPAQDENLHNGLKSLPERRALQSGASGSATAITSWTQVATSMKEQRGLIEPSNRPSVNVMQSARAQDLIHRVMLRPEVSAALGKYFMKGITAELLGLKSRDVKILASAFRHETETSELEGGGKIGETGKSDENPDKDGSRMKGEIELLLRALETLEAPTGYKGTVSTEDAKRNGVALSRALGNAFVNLGMTLPAGPRDDPLRNDTVAIEMGERIMMSGDGPVGGKQASKSEEGFRKEVATALGRAILHLQAAAGIQASRGVATARDAEQKERIIKLAVGRLTLQLLESTAARAGKSITKDPLRREVLAKALGSAFIQMESTAARSRETDRNKLEMSALKRGGAPTGPEKPTNVKMVVRLNKPSEIIVQRPIIGGRDAAPPTIPRFKSLRG